MNIAELLISAYAKKYGISEEEAKRALTPILSDENKLERFRKLLAELGQTADTLNSLPDEVKPVAASILMGDVLGRQDDDIRELRKLMREALIIRMVLSSAFSDSEPLKDLNNKLKEISNEVSKLKEYIEKKKEIAERKKLMKVLKILDERIRDVENKIKEGAGTNELKKEISRIKADINRMVDIFRKVSSGGEGSGRVMTVLDELVPVFVEYLKNPSKIKELFDAISSIGAEAAGKKMMEKEVSKEAARRTYPSRKTPPKLEEFLEVESGGEEAG